MPKQDCTKTIERVEAAEDRFGLTFSGLCAYAEFDSDEVELHLNGEASPRTGSTLSESLDIVVAAYGADGRVLGSEEHYLNSETFFQLDTFSIHLYLPEQPARLRVYPRKAAF